jgi:5-methyltetrahydrofolate--homocysteine methyltransferase
VASLKVEQEETKERYFSNLNEGRWLTYDEAKSSGFKTEWKPGLWANPVNLNRQVRAITVSDLMPYMDWSPFFWAWEMKGIFPTILNSPRWGMEAKKLYQDALAHLDHISKNELWKPKSVTQFWACNSVGDDIEIYKSGSTETLERFNFLRQQKEKTEDKIYYSLADFVAPKSCGFQDYIGTFALTTGKEVEDLAKEYEMKGDDYNAIMLKVLGDRLAEAHAEFLHMTVRVEIGIEEKGQWRPEDLIGEKYRGIRPAPGYPACPDHTEKKKLWKLMDVQQCTGITLTENLAMHPASSISGFYFFHPDAKYFRVGRVQRDQIEDYAKRKNMPVEQVEKWLSSQLAYS